MTFGRLKHIVKRLLPPVAYDLLRRLRRSPAVGPAGKPEWEYTERGEANWDELPGWNAPSIGDTQRAKWRDFVSTVQGSGPLGVSHESPEISGAHYSSHNTMMSFAYVLARAARNKAKLSMLDWGGGAGHYAVIARALLPDVEIRYTCKDLPILCALGREFLPGDEFLDDEDAALGKRYDLVLSSSSLQYSRNPYATAARLCHAAAEWLMITRLPVIEELDDFVVIQRPYAYGYATEYPGWFINRKRLIHFIEDQGFALEREFLVDERPYVPNAPEQCRYGGFLFRRMSRG